MANLKNCSGFGRIEVVSQFLVPCPWMIRAGELECENLVKEMVAGWVLAWLVWAMGGGWGQGRLSAKPFFARVHKYERLFFSDHFKKFSMINIQC